VFDELRGVYPSVTFQNVDVDNSPELTQQYGVRSVPTVVFEKNGQEIRRLVGLNPKSTYVNIINQNI
jgi:thioredoxin 1